MRRGTNVSLSMKIPGQDLSSLTGAKSIYVTIQQGGKQLTLGGFAAAGDNVKTYRVTCSYDGTDSTLHANLTQQETLAFGCEEVEIQVRWRDMTTNDYKATNIQKIDVLPILLDRELVI